jgi:hypothetical protein
MRELSAGCYRLTAVDREGRRLESDGADESELERKAHLDAYLYDNMVINKFLLHSLRGRNAVAPLERFKAGYQALDDSPEGWQRFRSMLEDLVSRPDDLTAEEQLVAGELLESLSIAFPILLATASASEERN